MSELFQMFFISNPELFLLVSSVAVVFFIMAVVFPAFFSNRIRKLPYYSLIQIVGFISAFGIAMYGMNFMFNGVIFPASQHMSECEVSTVSIRVEQLGIESDRDITVCRHRVDFESEEFTAYQMNTEQSNISLDRARQVARCIDVEADLYVNHDNLIAANDTMSVQVCIKYSDLSYGKLQTAINGTPSK